MRVSKKKKKKKAPSVLLGCTYWIGFVSCLEWKRQALERRMGNLRLFFSSAFLKGAAEFSSFYVFVFWDRNSYFPLKVKRSFLNFFLLKNKSSWFEIYSVKHNNNFWGQEVSVMWAFMQIVCYRVIVVWEVYCSWKGII